MDFFLYSSLMVPPGWWVGRKCGVLWASEILSICDFGVNGCLEIMAYIKTELWMFCCVLNSSFLILAQNALAGCRSAVKMKAAV